MKRILTPLIFVACIAAVCAACNVATAKPVSLRIMGYNIRNCTGMDDVRDFERGAEVLNRVSADIIALQEIDSATRRCEGIDVLGKLALMTSMHPTFGPAIDHDGGKYGVGILSKEKPVTVRNIPLPGREERRTLLIAEFEDYVFCCTHLSLTEEDRVASIGIIEREAAAYDKPLFIAGDFNARPESEAMVRFAGKFELLSDPAQNTFPAGNPRGCIDYIAAYKSTGYEIEVTGRFVDQATIASDHCPLWVDIKIKQ